MGSIPIARSITPVDAIGASGLPLTVPLKYPILDAVGGTSLCRPVEVERDIPNERRFYDPIKYTL